MATYVIDEQVPELEMSSRRNDDLFRTDGGMKPWGGQTPYQAPETSHHKERVTFKRGDSGGALEQGTFRPGAGPVDFSMYTPKN